MSEKTEQKQDTRFQPGQSGNPAGKPKGARHKTTELAEKLMSDDVEGVVRSVLNKAKDGDMQAAKIVLDRIVPPRKGRQIEADIPEANDLKGVAEAQAAILSAVADGILTPDEGKTVSEIVESRRKAIETLELEQRISELERKTR